MHQVERACREPGAPRVCRHDLDVAQPALAGEPPCRGHVGRVSADAHDAPARGYPLGQQLDDAARAAAGHANTQIARRPGLSEGTVRKHLENIYVRLQVSSRTAAVTRAFPGRS